jgi:tetratricopeptide (TPR) repeat protein
VRRNPVTSFAIASAAAFFIGASIVSTVAYIKTSVALAKEEQRLRDAMSVVDVLFTRVSEDKLLNQPGMQGLRKELLTQAKEYYEKFLRDATGDPRVQDGVARTHYRLGRIAFLLGSPDDALDPFNRARQIQERLVVQKRNDAGRQSALGDTLNALGEVWVLKKDFASARRDYEAAATIRSTLSNEHPTDVEYQRVLANTHMNAGIAEFNDGNRDQARELLVKAQDVRQAALKNDPENVKLRRDLAKGYYSLARIDGILNNHAAAETDFKRAIDLLERLCAEEPDDLDQRKLLAVSYRLLGDLLSLVSEDRTADRRKYYEQALARLDPLAEQNPDVVDYQTERAAALLNLFDAESASGNSAAARSAIEGARDVYLRLVERFPDRPRHKCDLAVALRELAREQINESDPKASENLAEATRLLSQLVERYPEDADFAEQLEATKQLTRQAQQP